MTHTTAHQGVTEMLCFASGSFNVHPYTEWNTACVQAGISLSRNIAPPALAFCSVWWSPYSLLHFIQALCFLFLCVLNIFWLLCSR